MIFLCISFKSTYMHTFSHMTKLKISTFVHYLIIEIIVLDILFICYTADKSCNKKKQDSFLCKWKKKFYVMPYITWPYEGFKYVTF